MNETLPTFNGINGATGSYLLPPMSARELAAIAKGEPLDENLLQDLASRHRLSSTKRALKEGIDPKDLSQAGWGVVYAFSDKEKVPAIQEALSELLSLRREQAGERFREFSAVDAYRPGESKTDFLARHGAGPGPVDPGRVPYYLLLVGDPQAIPYSFQYQLDVQYAVGRLHFDHPEEYATYAASVAQGESGPPGLTPETVFFGVENPDDQATRLSASYLVKPLADQMGGELEKAGRGVRRVVGDAATKAALAGFLGGDSTPSLLFAASHGMGFPRDDPRQLPHQGALLCQDWPGPAAWTRPIPEDHYFSGDDLADEARVQGLLAFFFACYGAGTPHLDDFAHQAFREQASIAPHPFLARLPQRLLGHPRGGALAVIGHVERAWGYSFLWDQAGSQLAVFESALRRLLAGHPVGSAMEYFNQRYAELSTVLSEELRGIQFGKIVDELALAGMWTANNDARSYVVLGDPAVRLPAIDLAPAGVEAVKPVQISYPTERKTDRPLASPGGGAEVTTVLEPGSDQIEASQSNPVEVARAHLIRGMSALAEMLGGMLEAASDPGAGLSISTYTSPAIDQVAADFPAGTKLQARTQIQLAGDTELVLPEGGGEPDETVWARHLEMVEQVRRHRSEMLIAAASISANLLEALKMDAGGSEQIKRKG